MQEILHKEHEQNDDSTPRKLCGIIGVIAANPAQSKHLEMATMRGAATEAKESLHTLGVVIVVILLTDRVVILFFVLDLVAVMMMMVMILDRYIMMSILSRFSTSSLCQYQYNIFFLNILKDLGFEFVC